MVNVYQERNGKLILLRKAVDDITAMDYVWDSEMNTEETPIRAIDLETGKEVEW